MNFAGKVWLRTGIAFNASASTVKSSMRTSTPPASRMMMSNLSSYQLPPTGVATIGFGSTSRSSLPRRGATLSFGITEHAAKINTLMCSDNADDRAATPIPALILVIVPQCGKSELGGHRLPLRLKIVAQMMRQADSARVEIDVHH